MLPTRRATIYSAADPNEQATEETTEDGPFLMSNQMQDGKTYWCSSPFCTNSVDSTFLDSGMPSNEKNKHNGYIKQKK